MKFIYKQTDLRQDFCTINELSKLRMKPITVEQAEKLAERIGAVKYVECSAVTRDTVNNVFDEAIKPEMEVSVCNDNNDEKL